jgi:hypothetical protein
MFAGSNGAPWRMDRKLSLRYFDSVCVYGCFFDRLFAVDDSNTNSFSSFSARVVVLIILPRSVLSLFRLFTLVEGFVIRSFVFRRGRVCSEFFGFTKKNPGSGLLLTRVVLAIIAAFD